MNDFLVGYSHKCLCLKKNFLNKRFLFFQYNKFEFMKQGEHFFLEENMLVIEREREIESVEFLLFKVYPKRYNTKLCSLLFDDQFFMIFHGIFQFKSKS